ncbi:uncharacterized protein BDZ83DRAFT_629619 [Colletotrichum acutatum]|uniref:Uncharacterized protein n=1 Tax=Glomerella acutata TaxID=27357 RepID=A0AAD8UIV8_GLOAC|nr:uncharacterized protein BDZ83DRAFT_629619 [Colletotrichum acutatum]KAK1722261.1 hypothetical protein BDZ83DRAFT_629619 [Colletotrichum acutatum]
MIGLCREALSSFWLTLSLKGHSTSKVLWGDGTGWIQTERASEQGGGASGRQSQAERGEVMQGHERRSQRMCCCCAVLRSHLI